MKTGAGSHAATSACPRWETVFFSCFVTLTVTVTFVVDCFTLNGMLVTFALMAGFNRAILLSSILSGLLLSFSFRSHPWPSR